MKVQVGLVDRAEVARGETDKTSIRTLWRVSDKKMSAGLEWVVNYVTMMLLVTREVIAGNSATC